MNTFGSRLKFLLKKAGISQSSLAEMTKIPLRTISSYVNDEKEPGLEKVKAIAGVLHADLNQLVFGTRYLDNIEPEKIWRVGDNAGEYAVTPDALYKRLRTVLMFTGQEQFAEIMKTSPAEFGVMLESLEELVDFAQLEGFKEDLFWLMTGHTKEQWRQTILGKDMSALLNKIEQLPEEKLKLVKDLIDNLK